MNVDAVCSALFCFIVVLDWVVMLSASTSTTPGRASEPITGARQREKKFYLVSLEIGPAAGGKALLAAEVLQLAPHAQGIALDADLLAPGAHDLHVGRILIWNRAADSGSDSGCVLLLKSALMQVHSQHFPATAFL